MYATNIYVENVPSGVICTLSVFVADTAADPATACWIVQPFKEELVSVEKRARARVG
jgi:hypothetical protein